MTAVALVACSAAGADPAGSSHERGARPAGWKQLPAIAAAVEAGARGDGVVVDAVDAWGEPAVGCYAVWLALHGGTSDSRVLADQILVGLARVGQRPPEIAGGARPAQAPPAAIAVGELTMPSAPEGVLAFAFTRAPYRGRVRAQLGHGRIAATACFANQREPGACDAPCASVLRGAP